MISEVHIGREDRVERGVKKKSLGGGGIQFVEEDGNPSRDKTV